MKSLNMAFRSGLDHSSPDIYKDVKEFFDLAQPQMLQKPDQLPDSTVVRLALFLIDQEVNLELKPDLERLATGSFSREITARVLDNIVDSIYVLTWTAIALNLPFNPAWKAVQEANMKKFPLHPDCDGKGCDFKHTDLIVTYEEKEITVTVQCVGGRVVARNNANGKVIKPKDWEEPPVFEILHEHWKELNQVEMEKEGQLGSSGIVM